MFERDVPVYLVTGFLESGKTKFLNFTIQQDYFKIREKTLLIVCEEGEEEYDIRELVKCNTVMEIVEDQAQFTESYLKELDKTHRPERVLIEYNPLWSVDALYKMKLPRGWDMAQHIVTVDASSFQVYMNNMKSLFVEMIRSADMVLFNRSSTDLPLANFRRSVKVVNAGAETLFEDEEGNMIDAFQEDTPYDMDADPIEIDDIDFGIWYVDMMDHLDKYIGKRVRFTGQVLKSRKADADYFVPGRRAITCCAEDTQFIGYVCKHPMAKSLKMGAWVQITATIKKKFMHVYGEEGPVLYAESIEPAKKPEQEMVYFT